MLPRRKLWIVATLIMPIAFVVITVTRRGEPPSTVVEEVPMPVLPPLSPSLDAGVGDRDAGPTD